MVTILVLILPYKSKACDIDFEVLKGKKDLYKPGDTIVVKVKVSLIHRTCPVSIRQTKFKINGFKVIGATKWKQKPKMIWERKLQIRIISNEDGKLMINAVRTCDKDGGFGSMSVKAVPIDN